MLRRAFVLLQLEATCAGFNLLVWTVPTPINKYRHLFVHIYLFIYLLYGVFTCAIAIVRSYSCCWLCALLLLMRSAVLCCRLAQK
jgi:hypothetical protein